MFYDNKNNLGVGDEVPRQKCRINQNEKFSKNIIFMSIKL
jgi:hypothetical protein